MANEHDNTYFSANQAYFHGFGRAFSAKGQDFVDQAPLKAGHNLDTYSIRSKVIPFIDSNYIISGTNSELDGQSIFTDPNAVSRTVRSEFANVIKFYDGVMLSSKPGTNDETWQLVDDGNVIAGFVDPTDKFSADGSAKATGYTMELLTGTGDKIPSEAGQTWAFNAFNGTVTFAWKETPTEHSDWEGIRIRAFAYVGDLLEDRLKAIENGIGDSNTTAASGINAVEEKVSFISGTLSGYDDVNTVSAAIAEVRANAALFSLSAVEDAGDFAAQYRLMQTINNVTTPVEGSIINIPKDQFLSQAEFGYMTADNGTGEWNDKKDQTYQYPTLKLTFALDVNDQIEGVQSSVFIPMHDLINDYDAASGVQYDENTNTFSVKIDNATEDFLTVGANGVRLSGVQEAIDTAVEALGDEATAGLTTLSGALTDYLEENAISGKFAEVDDNINTNKNNIETLTKALNKYTGENSVSAKFKSLEDSINAIHNNDKIVSGIVTTATVQGSINNNTLTVDVLVSDYPGNAIVVKEEGTSTPSGTGVWAQAYKAGTGINFGTPENGIIPIEATYELPVATSAEIGGIKAGQYVEVDASGAVIIKKVENGLAAFDNTFTFDGSKGLSIVKGNYLNSTVDANGDTLTLEVVAEGLVEASNSGLIKGAQVYEVSSNLATAITTASEELSGAISSAYTSGMIVIGDSDKIVASEIKLGVDREFDNDTDHVEFGSNDKTAATEMTVKNFVNYGLDDLATAISGFNAEVEAIA